MADSTIVAPTWCQYSRVIDDLRRRFPKCAEQRVERTNHIVVLAKTIRIMVRGKTIGEVSVGVTLHEIISAARGRRRDLGITQEQLASRLGVSRNLIRNFERETGATSLVVALRILDVLGLELDFPSTAVVATRDDQQPDRIDLDELLAPRGP